MLLCSDPGRTTVILRLCRHLHKKWEKILSPFLYPCYVGNLQENLWCRDGVSCRRRRCETREPSSRGLPRGEKVAGMATVPGTTSVGRRESTLGVAGDDRCRLPIVLNRQLALPHGHDAVYRTLTLFLLSLPVSVLSVANSTNTDTNTCNPAHNGLATGTLQYNSDCNATTWCNNGVCQNKGCRRDEFPLGYNTGDSRGGKNIDPPPKCSVDEFCPDEGSQCAQRLMLDNRVNSTVMVRSIDAF
jgi:hypothetical protein